MHTNAFPLPHSIFLYLVLSGAFAGVCYFVYNTYIAAFFPQPKRTKAPKKIAVVVDKEPVSGGEGSASGTDKASFDESWIHMDHINRPTASRVKSGASAKSKKGAQ